MTMTKHPSRPNIFVATTPLDFIGWDVVTKDIQAKVDEVIFITVRRKGYRQFVSLSGGHVQGGDHPDPILSP